MYSYVSLLVYVLFYLSFFLSLLRWIKSPREMRILLFSRHTVAAAYVHLVDLGSIYQEQLFVWVCAYVCAAFRLVTIHGLGFSFRPYSSSLVWWALVHIEKIKFPRGNNVGGI